MSTATRLVTAMRYRDVAAAVEWLCTSFGFEKQTVSLSDTGAVLYAQLTFGNAMLMLAPVRGTTVDQFMKQPDEIGGAETQSCYFVIDDVDAHHARAKAAGAVIVLDLEDDGSGGRGYSCRDPEGHIWSFGTHDPWQGARPQVHGAPQVSAGGRGWRLAAGAAGVLVLAVTAGWMSGVLKQTSAVTSTARQVEEQGAEAEQHKEAAERALRDLREELERERSAKAAAERAAQEVQKRVAEEQRAKEGVDRAVQQARDDLERERSAKTAAERAGQEAQKRTADEQRARSVAEQAAQEARDQLGRERAAKVAAERSSQEAEKRVAVEKAAREAAERTAKVAEEQARQDPEGRLAAARQGKETAERALEEARAQVAEAQKASEVAERAANEARALVTREQNAKNAAWKANAQLRRQLSQAAQEPATGEAAAPLTIGNDNTVVPKAQGPRPKGQKTKSADPDE